MDFFMQNTSTENTTRLIEMVRELIEIIRFENTYAWQLLKDVTCNKKTMFTLDESSIYLESSCNDDYILIAREAKDEVPLQFSTSSRTLRSIMAGSITIDQAIVKSELYVKAPFEDLVNMYRLTACLLAEGPLNARLRNLWQHFNRHWNNQLLPVSLIPLEQQKALHGYLVKSIPENVLLVKM